MFGISQKTHVKIEKKTHTQVPSNSVVSKNDQEMTQQELKKLNKTTIATTLVDNNNKFQKNFFVRRNSQIK